MLLPPNPWLPPPALWHCCWLCLSSSALRHPMVRSLPPSDVCSDTTYSVRPSLRPLLKLPRSRRCRHCHFSLRVLGFCAFVIVLPLDSPIDRVLYLLFASLTIIVSSAIERVLNYCLLHCRIPQTTIALDTCWVFSKFSLNERIKLKIAYLLLLSKSIPHISMVILIHQLWNLTEFCQT